ncbi:aldehyde dehydrogenase family protein [Vibrio mimicus]|uniref:aldehyde dehydrogenase family protein n=1 Tax=Vibrio mimicus TaxID=674 RepID=UPI002F9331BE
MCETALETSCPLHKIKCVGFDGNYETRKSAEVLDFNSNSIANICIAPPIYIHELVETARSRSVLDLKDIQRAIQRSADIFLYETIEGLTSDDYVMLTHRATGLPKSVIQCSIGYIANALKNIGDTVQLSLPVGMSYDLIGENAINGTAILSRKGDVLSVIAAGNGPGLHALWPQAVAMGYKTVVKPSNSEPFTAQRLVKAMILAGLNDYVSLCCTDHQGTRALIDDTDLSIIYGSKTSVALYANNPNVLVQGPGHSKVVITSEIDEDESIGLAAESIMSLGGAACVSASVVYVEGDVKKYASRLAEFFSNEVLYEQYPKVALEKIEIFKTMLEEYQSDGNFGFKTIQTDDGTILAPYVDYSLKNCEKLKNRELPFPCVVVLPLNKQTIAKDLKGSLSVSIFSRNKNLIQEILQQPNIGNVYIGAIPTTWMAMNVPHDGYLSEFLVKSRGYRIQEKLIF